MSWFAVFCSRAEPRASTFCSRAATSAALLVVGLTLALWTDHARAYSDKERFTAPAACSPEGVCGGGGGRFFTGSPVDGYGCNVCHQGGVEPKVQVLGLPEDGYAPGRLYEIEVVWENPTLPHALQLEFVGRDGRAAGQLVLIDPNKVDVGQRCTSGDKTPADYDATAPGRKILGVLACGATHMRFRYGPPDTPDVSFAMSVVVSDKMGSAAGDGTLNLQRVLRRAGEPAPNTGNCALAPRAKRGPSAAALWLGASLALLLGLRRRR